MLTSKFLYYHFNSSILVPKAYTLGSIASITLIFALSLECYVRCGILDSSSSFIQNKVKILEVILCTLDIARGWMVVAVSDYGSVQQIQKVNRNGDQRELHELVHPEEPAIGKSLTPWGRSTFAFRSPSPLLPRRSRITQLVFKQINSHALHVLFDVFFPVERLHVEVEELLIVGVQIAPKLLHVVVREGPFVGAEEADDVGELVDFLVSFQQSSVEFDLNFNLGHRDDSDLPRLFRATKNQKVDEKRGNDVQQYRVQLVHVEGLVHEEADVPEGVRIKLWLRGSEARLTIWRSRMDSRSRTLCSGR